MANRLKKEDFFDDGMFSNLILPTKLPIPTEIVEHVYGVKCGKILAKSCQLNLLKHIWKLKGFEMEWCVCKTEHLIISTEYNEAKFIFLTTN